MFGYLVKSGGFIMKSYSKILVAAIVCLLSVSLFGNFRPATTEQVAQATMSACGLAKSIQELESADIYVLGNEKIAQALKKYEGCRVGDVIIKSIKSGNSLPKVKPNVLVCGNKEYIYMTKYYCRNNNILSIGAYPELCYQGLTLSLYRQNDDKDGESLSKVRLLLNSKSAKMERVSWNRSISSVSYKVKNHASFTYK